MSPVHCQCLYTKCRLIIKQSNVALFVFSILSTVACKPAPMPNPSISGAQVNTLPDSGENLVTLYTDTNFKGSRTILKLHESCVNLSGSLNDEASSVDANGGCVILCQHSSCRGRCEQVDYFSSDLSHIGLNDAISSIKPCYI